MHNLQSYGNGLSRLRLELVKAPRDLNAGHGQDGDAESDVQPVGGTSLRRRYGSARLYGKLFDCVLLRVGVPPEQCLEEEKAEEDEAHDLQARDSEWLVGAQHLRES